MKVDITCRECGAHEGGDWPDNVANVLQQRQVCTSCSYWYGWYVRRNEPEVVRILGTHYHIEPGAREEIMVHGRPAIDPFESAPHRYFIHFKDGREVSTMSLLCQGKIPPHWRERLPDNAFFLPQE